MEIWHRQWPQCATSGADNGLSGTSADLVQTMVCVAWIPVTWPQCATSGADNGLSGTSADLAQTMVSVAWIPVTCDLTGNSGIGLPNF